MRIKTWNDWIVALSLIHLGQQLGANTPMARSVFNFVELVRVFFAP